MSERERERASKSKKDRGNEIKRVKNLVIAAFSPLGKI